MWIVNGYIEPHFYRQSPSGQDTDAELHAFLLTIPSYDCIYLCGDFNSRLARNIPNLTGHYCIHSRTNEQGEYLKDVCQDINLYAISTHFCPKSRKANKIMPCTGHGTYISPFKDRTPTQIDYIFVSNDFKSHVINCHTTWQPAIAAYGRSEDHAMIVATIRIKVNAPRRSERPDFSTIKDNRDAFNGHSQVLIHLKHCHNHSRSVYGHSQVLIYLKD